jgi:2-enoate reductase
MVGKFNRLFESIKIGEVEIKNRIAMAPMGIVGLVNLDGSPGPRAIDYYLERAKGGVGLIITSLFKVENEVESLQAVLPFVSHHALGPFAELAEAVHSLGTKIFVQLTAGLGRVAPLLKLKDQLVSASAIPHYWNPSRTCRELKIKEVEQIVKAFGNAAEILAAAGVDGVELHGHEGYLFDQFTTALWNKRRDKYGGDLEGRLRLPFEVLKRLAAMWRKVCRWPKCWRPLALILFTLTLAATIAGTGLTRPSIRSLVSWPIWPPRLKKLSEFRLSRWGNWRIRSLPKKSLRKARPTWWP